MVCGWPWTIRPSFSLGVEYPDPTRVAAIDVPGTIYLHAVRHAGLGAAKLREHAISLTRQRAVRRHIEGPNVPAPTVVNVKHAFVRREGKAVGGEEVVDEGA